MVAVTAPFAVGVSVAVNVLASTVANVPSVPLLTAMSLAAKPVTFSVKAIVIGILVCFVGLVTVEVIVALGRLAVERDGELRGPRRSRCRPCRWRAPAAMLAVTAPLAVGVIVAV